MKRYLWILLVVSVAGAGFATLSGIGVLGRELSPVQSAGQIVVGPDKWVPFSAISTIVDERGSTAVGRFYRASDGSTRNETGPALDQINIVGIKNILEGSFYRWRPSDGWESNPMDLPPSGYRPQRRKNVTTAMLADPIEGFSVIKRTDGNGVTMYEAPELNFFAVRVVTPCRTHVAAGCGISLSQIAIGEQPQEYFRPPVGERIVRRSESGGIVSRKHK